MALNSNCTDLKNKQERNGLVYLPNETKPFSGKFCDYYTNGFKLKESYKNGKLNGLKSQWYKNNQKKFEKFYIDGKLNGPVFYWYENGQKKSEQNYKNNKKDGDFLVWHENGQIEVKDEFDKVYDMILTTGQKVLKEGLISRSDYFTIFRNDNSIFFGYRYWFEELEDLEGFVLTNQMEGGNLVVLSSEPDVVEGYAGFEVVYTDKVDNYPDQIINISDFTEEKVYEMFEVVINHEMYSHSFCHYKFHVETEELTTDEIKTLVLVFVFVFVFVFIYLFI